MTEYFSKVKLEAMVSCLVWTFVLVSVAVISPVSTRTDTDIPHHEVSNWALRFGFQMWEIGRQTTRLRDIQERYQKEAKVEKVDGLALVREMSEDIQNMMADKVEAVKRIMDVAEQAAISHEFEPRKSGEYEYYNAKRLNNYDEGRSGDPNYKELTLKTSRHFDNAAVNFSISAVHVPTNVYDEAPAVMTAIQWSEHLNRIFTSNYEMDPSLNWQYFGSSTGFMRQYPAMKWPLDETDPDLFDCRLRPWYLQAAASPKDVFILVDTSGSMTGVRREIAKHVVLTILDTLSENDFVNIYNFSENSEPVVPCFREKLVQANSENLRELRVAMEQLETVDIANFTSALVTAFEVLTRYNRTFQGSQCNQAIMLITDGAPSTYKDIFDKYNLPHKPIRVFTYLIGREVTDTAATNWMACNNKGYFVHVKTLAEVREQVLKYVPVLSRPMVMYQKHHPVIWTPVYADISDSKMSDWLWEVRERRRQRDRTTRYRQLLRLYQESGSYTDNPDKTIYTNSEVKKFLNYGEWRLNERQIAQLNAARDKDLAERTARSKQRYRLMTSVATPVFDRKSHSNITERTLINDAIWVERIRTVRTANLLGVAGADVPVRDIVKLATPYKLGVNGYSYIVNNNGFLLHHPDFRPVYHDILKPNYNAVDLSEVELMDSDNGPRENDTALLTMRKEMVDRREGETTMRVRVHYDGMKRASVRRQRYYYRWLKDTPFSLGLALPDGYGHFRVVAETEIKRLTTYHNVSVNSFFAGDNWRVHPDWVYCKYNYDMNRPLMSPEEEVVHFIGRTQQPGWKWNSKHPRPNNHDNSKSSSTRKSDSEAYYCDKHLMQSLVFDAQATEVFNRKVSIKHDRVEGRAAFQMFGISVAFIATKSGLTRWQDINTLSENNATNPDESMLHENEVLPLVRRRRAARRRPFQRKNRFQTMNVARKVNLDPPKRKIEYKERHFSKSNKRAIDEVWYKRAVEQYEVEPESFVYSVPFEAGLRTESVVTASHAIFVEKDGHRAPAAAVGLQYKNSIFREIFFNITSKCTGDVPCGKTCNSEELDCFVLDNNGFVVISENLEHTGKFFGEIDGTIMDSLVYYEVYQRIRIYDYQAICFDTLPQKSSASLLLTPLKLMRWAAHWFAGRMAWLLVQTQLAELISPDWAWALQQQLSRDEEEEEEEDEGPVSEGDDLFDRFDGNGSAVVKEGADLNPPDLPYINRTRTRPCDKQADLYSLQADRLAENSKPRPVKGRLANCNSGAFSRPCGRNFSVHKIPHSNLVLLVLDTLCECETRKLSAEPVEILYNETQLCDRMQDHLFRKRPTICLNYHPEEEEIKLCGAASTCFPLTAFSVFLVTCLLRFLVT